MPEADCPNCEEVVRFSTAPTLGQKVTCPYCRELLEVVELKPLELDYAGEEDDDGDFDDDSADYEYDNDDDDDDDDDDY